MKKKSSIIKFGIIAIILLGLTLPFHYVPSSMKVIKKDKLSFNNTIITKGQIDEYLGRYNDCQILSQQESIRKEPFFKLLNDNGLIYQNKTIDAFFQ